MTYFEGTEHETKRCPRRHLLDHPDLTGVYSLRRACDGKPGVDGAQKLTSMALEGLAVVDDAVAFFQEGERKKAEGEAALKAGAKR